jgi:hypothetical protein
MITTSSWPVGDCSLVNTLPENGHWGNNAFHRREADDDILIAEKY